jgi:hypothetical protein
MLPVLRILAPLSLLLSSTAALAHPFLDVQPLPVASVESGANYNLTLAVFPGDTPVQSVQLDFELSSAGAFGAPSGTLGDGFSLLYDGVGDLSTSRSWATSPAARSPSSVTSRWRS